MISKFAVLLFLISAGACPGFGLRQVVGNVHDPHHRPIANAEVTLRAAHSAFVQSSSTNQDGEFAFVSIPLGDYTITIAAPGFGTAQQQLTVASGSSDIFHFQLAVATVEQSTRVTAQPEITNTDSATPSTLVSREDIAHTPGAGRTNSIAMITDYVPGAYMTHDMLHMRGGHQLSWLIDGVPIPTPTSPATSAHRSTLRISTISKPSAAATTPTSATAPTASSTSSRAPASSATAKANSSPPPATSTRPTTS